MTPTQVYVDSKSHFYYEALEEKLNDFSVYNQLSNISPILKSATEAADIANGLSRYVPDKRVPFTTEIISRSIDLLDSTARNKIENLVIQRINLEKPDIHSLSIQDRTAYAMFLESPNLSYILKNNQEFISMKNTVIRSIQGANANDLDESLTILKQYQKQSNLTMINIDIATKQLLNGQKRFTDVIDNQTGENKLNFNEIKEKLEKLGVNVDDKLEKVLSTNGEVHNNINTIYDYVLEQQEKEQEKGQQEKEEEQNRIQDIQGVMSSFGFVGALGSYLNNDKICKIGVVGQSLTTIHNSMTIMSKLDVVYSLANLSNFANIGMAVLSMASLFKSKGPNESQMILKAIQQISQQLFTMRKEMHERFDRIEEIMGKMFTLLISEFSEVHISNYRIERMLEIISHKIEMSEELLRSSLVKISSQLVEMGNLTTIAERQKIISSLSEKIGFITGPHSIGLEKFKELFNQLRLEACENSRNNIFLVGNRNSSIPEQVRSFLQSPDPSCNIALVQFAVIPNTRDVSANPQVWAWASLAFMLLVEMRYKINGTGRRISKAEWEEIAKFIQVGTITQQFLNHLNNEIFRDGVNDMIIEAENEYNALVIQFQKDEESNLSKEIIAQWEKEFDKSDKPYRDIYEQAIIPVNPDAAKNTTLYADFRQTWFRNMDRCHNLHGVFETFTTRIIAHVQGGKGRWYAEEYWGGTKGYGGQGKYNDYKAICEKEIKDLKKAYLDTFRNSIFNKAGPIRDFNFHFDEPSEVTDNLFAFCVMVPSQLSMPYLSTPHNFKPPIQHVARELEALNIGKYCVSYNIENNVFTLKVSIVINKRIIYLLQGSCSYTPSVSSGIEAIYRWWENGSYSIGDVTWDYWETNPGHRQQNWCIVPVRTFRNGRRMQNIELVSCLTSEEDTYLKTILNDYKLSEKSKFNTKLNNIIMGTDMPLAQSYAKLQYWKLVQSNITKLISQRYIFDITLRRLQYIQNQYANIIGENDAAMEEDLLRENKLLRRSVQVAGNVLNNVLNPEDRDRVVRIFMDTMRTEGLLLGI